MYICVYLIPHLLFNFSIVRVQNNYILYIIKAVFIL